MILNYQDKEFKLVPRTRKIIDLTERLKAKNLNDLIFGALSDCNVKVLAEIILTFAENEEGKQVFSKKDFVYDFIDEWKEKNGKDYMDLFKEIIVFVNEMGFFKTKMTEKELKEQMENPLTILNLQELAINSAQKMMDKVAEEEFRGHLG